MKKRLLSLLLLLTFCFMSLPMNVAIAAEDQAVTTTEEQEIVSSWAINDLVIGDTYGIYPPTWYNKGMKNPITQAQVRVLLSGIRGKLISTNLVKNGGAAKVSFGNKITVKDVLEAFYAQLAAYDFSKSIGLEKRYSAVAYMADHKIFTGTEGELGYDDICTVEQACVIASRLITEVYDLLDCGSKGFLWEIKNGPNTVYLLGSIHLATYDIYPFSKKVIDAYNASDVLAVEVNIFDDSGSDLMNQYSMYQDGTTLKDHVNAETYERAIAFGESIGYPEDLFSLFKPWVIESTITAVSMQVNQEESMNMTALGVDYTFLTKALMQGKPIYEVEGYESQLKMLDSFSPELNEYRLNTALDSISSVYTEGNTDASDYLNFMLYLWHEGDVDTFRQLMGPSMVETVYIEGNPELSEKLSKEYHKKMMADRDLHMANSIEAMLNSEGGTYFVVLGSAHYISEYSVTDILLERGYTLTQIK